MELVKVKAFGTPAGSAEKERAAFLRLAGHIMKRMLAHHARPLSRSVQRVPVDEKMLPVVAGDQGLQEVEDALSRLAKIDPRLRAVVELEGVRGEDERRGGAPARLLPRYGRELLELGTAVAAEE